MRPLVGLEESRDLDRRAVGAGASADALVEAAAFGMLAPALQAFDRALASGLGGLVLALAGRGSNGADALALLRLLRAERPQASLIAILAREGEGAAARQHTGLRAAGIETLSYAQEGPRALALVDAASLILEGLAGTGLSGPLEGPAADLVERANQSRAFRLAVDLPAGLGQVGPVFQADLCAMVAPLKEWAFRPALRAACGRIVSVDGVFPPEAGADSGIALVEPADLGGLCPRLAPDAHKGTRGRLLIWAGAVGTSGAALLACRGAQAAGAGLVSLRLRPELLSMLSPRAESFLAGPLGGIEAETALASRADALLAGPGWSFAEPAPALLDALLALDRPLVLDADALSLYGRAKRQRRNSTTVLTPHPGELARLLGVQTATVLAEPRASAAGLARRDGVFVSLRAVCTWIVSPEDRCLVVDGMEPALACAGSGDLHAGLLAGLLARAAAGDRARFDPLALAAAAAQAQVLAGRATWAAKGFFAAEDLQGEVGRLIGAASRGVEARRLP